MVQAQHNQDERQCDHLSANIVARTQKGWTPSKAELDCIATGKRLGILPADYTSATLTRNLLLRAVESQGDRND